MFAGTYVYGWALCEGQLLSIPAYSAGLRCIGINYGDGHHVWLPDMRGRVVLGVSTCSVEFI
jgi:microcystin-dependent protein